MCTHTQKKNSYFVPGTMINDDSDNNKHTLDILHVLTFNL